MSGFLRAASAAMLMVSMAAAADIPRPAPNFPIPLTNGKTLQISDFKGKVVVVEFLLTTCPGCQAAARVLTKMQAQYGTDKLQVIGVAVNTGAEKLVGGFMQEYAQNFPVGYRDVNAAREFLQVPIMVRITFPRMVFIDKKGVIRSQHGGEDDAAFFSNEEVNIRKEIETLMNEKAGAAAAKKK